MGRRKEGTFLEPGKRDGSLLSRVLVVRGWLTGYQRGGSPRDLSTQPSQRNDQRWRTLLPHICSGLVPHSRLPFLFLTPTTDVQHVGPPSGRLPGMAAQAWVLGTVRPDFKCANYSPCDAGQVP